MACAIASPALARAVTVAQKPATVTPLALADHLLEQLDPGDAPLAPWGVDVARLPPTLDALPTQEPDRCPAAWATPLLWLRPKNLGEKTPYRRTLLCAVDLNRAFGGWADLQELAAPKPEELDRYVARHGAAWLGQVEEEHLMAPHGGGEAAVLLRTLAEAPSQRGHALAWRAGDTGFLAVQWTEETTAGEDLKNLMALRDILVPAPGSAGLFALTQTRLALELAQDKTLPALVRWRAAVRAKKLSASTVKVKRWREYFHTAWLLEGLRLDQPTGYGQQNAAAPNVRQTLALGRWPALSVSLAGGPVLKAVSLDRRDWGDLLPQGITQGMAPVQALGRALLTGWGAQKVDDSAAPALSYPVYEATFTSQFAPVVGHLWVFERRDDAVAVVALGQTARDVGQGSVATQWLKWLDLQNAPGP